MLTHIDRQAIDTEIVKPDTAPCTCVYLPRYSTLLFLETKPLTLLFCKSLKTHVNFLSVLCLSGLNIILHKMGVTKGLDKSQVKVLYNW